MNALKYAKNILKFVIIKTITCQHKGTSFVFFSIEESCHITRIQTNDFVLYVKFN